MITLVGSRARLKVVCLYFHEGSVEKHSLFFWLAWVAGVEQRAGQHTILMPDCLRLLSAFLTCISRYQRIASHIQKMHMDS